MYLYIVPCFTHNPDPLEAVKGSEVIRIFFFFNKRIIMTAMWRMDDKAGWTQGRGSERAWTMVGAVGEKWTHSESRIDRIWGLSVQRGWREAGVKADSQVTSLNSWELLVLFSEMRSTVGGCLGQGRRWCFLSEMWWVWSSWHCPVHPVGSWLCGD